MHSCRMEYEERGSDLFDSDLVLLPCYILSSVRIVFLFRFNSLFSVSKLSELLNGENINVPALIHFSLFVFDGHRVVSRRILVSHKYKELNCIDFRQIFIVRRLRTIVQKSVVSMEKTRLQFIVHSSALIREWPQLNHKIELNAMKHCNRRVTTNRWE